MENEHINKDLLTKYHANLLSGEENRRLLEHVCECTYCADLLAVSFAENDSLLPAPKNFKEGVLLKAARRKELFVKRQLFFYSMRVCTAMCGALFLLFSSAWKDAVISPSANIVYSAQEDIFQAESLLNDVQDSVDNFKLQIQKKINIFFSNEQSINNGGNDS